MSNTLEHHGVKGMKWGVRKDRKPKQRSVRRMNTAYKVESFTMAEDIKKHGPSRLMIQDENDGSVHLVRGYKSGGDKKAAVKFLKDSKKSLQWYLDNVDDARGSNRKKDKLRKKVTADIKLLNEMITEAATTKTFDEILDGYVNR